MGLLYWSVIDVCPGFPGKVNPTQGRLPAFCGAVSISALVKMVTAVMLEGSHKLTQLTPLVNLPPSTHSGTPDLTSRAELHMTEFHLTSQ